MPLGCIRDMQKLMSIFNCITICTFGHSLPSVKAARKVTTLTKKPCWNCGGAGVVDASLPDSENDAHLKKALSRIVELKTDVQLKMEEMEKKEAELIASAKHVVLLQSTVEEMLISNSRKKSVFQGRCNKGTETDIRGEIVAKNQKKEDFFNNMIG